MPGKAPGWGPGAAPGPSVEDLALPAPALGRNFPLRALRQVWACSGAFFLGMLGATPEIPDFPAHEDPCVKSEHFLI